MPQPADAGTLVPLLDLAPRNRGRVGRIRISRDQQVQVVALALQDFVRGHQSAYALVDQKASRETEGDETFWLGQRLQCIGINTGTRDQRDARGLDAEVEQRFTIVRILHEDKAGLAVQQPWQQPHHALSQEPRLPVDRGEYVAQAGDGVDERHSLAERGDRSIDAALQARMADRDRVAVLLDLLGRKVRVSIEADMVAAA